MNVLSKKIADFCEDGTTVEVAAEVNNRTVIFYVQTVDGKHRSDLGCWVTTLDSDGEVSSDDYPDFDIESIIVAAEKYIRELTKEIDTYDQLEKNGEYLTIVIDDKGASIVTRNDTYINADQSSYQRRLSDVIERFDTQEEAEYWISENCI